MDDETLAGSPANAIDDDEAAEAAGKDVMTMAAAEGPTVDMPVGSDINPELIPFGAGTFRHGVEIDATGKITNQGTIIGATNGGGKLSIKPEFIQLEADHLSVPFMGGFVRGGEEATMEAPFTEITADDIAKFTAATAKDGTGCKIVEPDETVTSGHYYKGLSYVGRTADGSPIVVWFKNAICTSGFELEGKKKEQGASTASFSCVADADAGASTKLPWKIVWPEAKEAASE